MVWSKTQLDGRDTPKRRSFLRFRHRLWIFCKLREHFPYGGVFFFSFFFFQGSQEETHRFGGVQPKNGTPYHDSEALRFCMFTLAGAMTDTTTSSRKSKLHKAEAA